jgi:predicted SnoaL-like aldol condensation-catalyzing enzyme
MDATKGLSRNEKKEMVRALLKSLETRDHKALGYIDPKKYIQHSPGVEDGLEGLKKLFSGLPGDTKVNTVRIFADGDYLVAHSEYNFFGPKVGFDIFRLENGKIVEHWDVLEASIPREQWKNANGKF